jgi:hypothetical protein
MKRTWYSIVALVMASIQSSSARAAPPERAENEGRPVDVQVESTRDGAELRRLDTQERVCLAPCRTTVSPGLFAVGGPALRQSQSIELSGLYPRVKISADPARRSTLFVGGALVGAAAVLGGAGLILGEARVVRGLEGIEGVKGEPVSLKMPAVLIGTGLVAAVTGVALMLSGETRVSATPLP